MKKYFRDYGATASVDTHRDGTATLRIKVGTKLVWNKSYTTEKGAVAAWKRFCA